MRLVVHVAREGGTVSRVVVSPVQSAAPESVAVAASDVTCIAADPSDPDRHYAGTLDHGLHRSSDGGRAWQPVGAGIAHPRVMAVAVAENGIVYAGTEPSSLYRSDDGGETWTDLASMRDLPSAPTWSFPPRPWTHHVRTISLSPADPRRLLVGIELGGVLRSLDGGETWEDRHAQAVIDPHRLETHARVTQRLYAAGGDGVSFSLDGGDTWRRDAEGMDRSYSWGLAVDPVDADLWYVSAAPGPQEAHGRSGRAQGRLYRNHGDDWEPLAIGDDRLLGAMPYVLLAPAPDVVLAILDDGTLHGSDDQGATWERVCSGLDGPLAAVATPA